MARTDSFRPSGISDRQSVVIDLLVQGATHQEASTVVGVSRTTVTEWANHHVQFIAELNVRRTARLDASASRLQTVVVKALVLLESEIDAGNVASATALLKMIGLGQLAAFSDPGPCSPLGAELHLAAKKDAEHFEQLVASSAAQDEVRRRSDSVHDDD